MRSAPAEIAPFNGRHVTEPRAGEPLTEAGAAERFARCHGDVVRFDHSRAQWLLFQQHRWCRDTDQAVVRLALAFARAWQREALEIHDSARRKDTLQFA